MGRYVIKESIDIAAVVGIFVLTNMHVSPSAKKRCQKCKVIKRRGVVMVVCENPRHKKRQGKKQRVKAG